MCKHDANGKMRSNVHAPNSNETNINKMPTRGMHKVRRVVSF